MAGDGLLMDLHWYVLRSKPNKELVLWRELIARGFECFYPQLHVRPVNPRSRTIRPYFPGYLFLHTPIEQAAGSLFQWMPFSGGFVCFDGTPASVPHHLVEAIRRHVEEVNEAGVARRQAASPQRGEAVVIHGGPFEGYEAIFDTRLSGTERVRVLLKLLGVRDVNLELPAGQVGRRK